MNESKINFFNIFVIPFKKLFKLSDKIEKNNSPDELYNSQEDKKMNSFIMDYIDCCEYSSSESINIKEKLKEYNNIILSKATHLDEKFKVIKQLQNPLYTPITWETEREIRNFLIKLINDKSIHIEIKRELEILYWGQEISFNVKESNYNYYN